MMFTVVGGLVDIQVNDYVLVSEYCIPSASDASGLSSDNYYQVVSTNVLNSTQVQIKYIGQHGVSTNLWIDTMWISKVLRPQTIA